MDTYPAGKNSMMLVARILFFFSTFSASLVFTTSLPLPTFSYLRRLSAACLSARHCYPRRLSARACRHVTSVGTQGCGLEIVRALETTYPQAWDAGLSTSSGLLVCTTSLPPTTFSTCLSPRHFRRNPGLGVGDLCGRLTRHIRRPWTSEPRTG